MNVLFFLPDLDGGGAERTIVNLANAFAADNKANTRVSLAVARADGPARDWLDPAVKLTDFAVGRTRRALGPLRRHLRDTRPDILVSTMVDANIIAAAACVGMHAPPRLILRETNSHRARGDLGFVRRRLAGWAYRRGDAIVALSRGVGSELTEDYRLGRDKVSIIHNPIDVEALRRAAECARERGPPWGGWAGSDSVLISAGRLTRQKGFDLLIEVFARLSERRTRLVILGDGPDRSDIEGRAAKLGVSERVLMPGFVSDPASWFAHATLFVSSSRWEGFGHVIVEAMACGAPVVATDCPHGPRDIITDGLDGQLVPTENPEKLARMIDRLLADPSARRRYAAVGAKRARHFDRSRIMAQYRNLMTNLLEIRRGEDAA